MKKGIIYSFIGIIIVVLGVFLYMLAISPLKTTTDNLQCEYNNISHQILCTQVGDVVPQWLDLKTGILPDNYSMDLIFKKSNNDYIAMHMIDKVFITDLNRKMIFALDNKNLLDYLKFKSYVLDATTNNYGSVVLFCSDNNLNSDVCKKMKQYSY